MVDSTMKTKMVFSYLQPLCCGVWFENSINQSFQPFFFVPTHMPMSIKVRSLKRNINIYASFLKNLQTNNGHILNAMRLLRATMSCLDSEKKPTNYSHRECLFQCCLVKRSATFFPPIVAQICCSFYCFAQIKHSQLVLIFIKFVAK